MNLGRFPRRKYTAHETPIEPMPNLSRALQQQHQQQGDDDDNIVHLWVKRDDMLGLAGGGNKTRKLEFVMADAMEQQHHAVDTIITCGAVQSNHCRLTLAACNKEGLKCILVLEERVPGSYKVEASGNNYLFHLLGAERIVHVGLGEAQAMVDQIANELTSEQQSGGGRNNVYCIPGGASNEIGATGYCACAAEIQVRSKCLLLITCRRRVCRPLLSFYSLCLTFLFLFLVYFYFFVAVAFHPCFFIIYFIYNIAPAIYATIATISFTRDGIG